MGQVKQTFKRAACPGMKFTWDGEELRVQRGNRVIDAFTVGDRPSQRQIRWAVDAACKVHAPGRSRG